MQALGVSATLSVGRAIVRDSFESSQMAQIYAYVGTALALGPIVGPIFGGFIEVAAGWQSVFFFLSGVGVVMLLIVVFMLRETNANLNRDATRPAKLIGNYATLLSTRLYMGYVLCNAICYGGIFEVLGTQPIRFTHWMPGIPWSMMIFMYDETRKYLMRATSPEVVDAVTGAVKRQAGWIEKSTYY